MNIKYLMAYLILPIAITSCSSGGNETEEIPPVTHPVVTKKKLRSAPMSVVLPKLQTLDLILMTSADCMS